MLPVNNMGLYQGLVQGILVILFWCYAILAFQALLIKGHLKNKFIMIIVVPIIISIVFFYEQGLFQYGFSLRRNGCSQGKFFTLCLHN